MTGTPKGRYRQYAEHEKQAAIALAIEHGVSRAASMLDMPGRTLTEWTKAAGGLPAIRQVSQEASFGAVRRAKAAVSDAVVQLLSDGKLSPAQVLKAWAEVIQHDAKLQTSPAGEPGASAAAQAIIRLEVPATDGKGTEILEIPRDRLELAGATAPDPAAGMTSTPPG